MSTRHINHLYSSIFNMLNAKLGNVGYEISDSGDDGEYFTEWFSREQSMSFRLMYFADTHELLLTRLILDIREQGIEHCLADDDIYNKTVIADDKLHYQQVMDEVLAALNDDLLTRPGAEQYEESVSYVRSRLILIAVVAAVILGVIAVNRYSEEAHRSTIHNTSHTYDTSDSLVIELNGADTGYAH